MKPKYTLLTFLFGYFIFSQNNSHSFENSSGNFSFVENRGQIYNQNYQLNLSVLYLLNTPGLNVQLKNNGFSYDVYETEIINEEINDKPLCKSNIDQKFIQHFHRIDIEFLNINADFQKLEFEKKQGTTNYYHEHIPNGIHGVNAYQKIVYKNFYNNIDLEFISKNDPIKPFEYNFVLHPGAKIDDIQLKIEGAESYLNDNFIDIKMQFGVIKEIIPASWFESKDGSNSVQVSFVQISENIYGLTFQNEKSKELLTHSKLIVDPTPVRQWGTYFDSGVFDSSESVVSVKSFEEYVYFVGFATKNGLATTGTFQTSFQGEVDGILAKFDDNGQRIWTTYCGSNLTDHLEDLDFDNNGNIYVTGATGDASGLFYTSGTHQSQNHGSYEGIILKFHQNGTLNWGTYYGGENYDWLLTISVDRENNFLYVGGTTHSRNHLTTPGAFQETTTNSSNPGRGLMAKFDLQGNRIWGSFYTGHDYDEIWDSKLDSQNNLIIGGIMINTNGLNLLDSFIAKISPNCEEIWKTFLGGYGHDALYTIDVNQQDEIVVCGYTDSEENIATPGTFVDSPTNDYILYAGFVMKFNPIGEKLWGSYIGDHNYNWAYGVAFSHDGNIYVAGDTKSSINIASENGYDTVINVGNTNRKDGFLIKLSPTGQRIWGTYYGGEDNDIVNTIYVTINNDIYLGGITASFSDIASTDVFQPTLPPNSGNAGFLAKFKDCQVLSEIIITCDENSISLFISDGSTGNWYGPNGFLGNGNSIVIENMSEADLGEYYVILDNVDCPGTLSTIINSLGGDAPVPDIPNLPTINGVCSITLVPPTATDDCMGTITAITTNPLFYDIPGEYWVIWTYIDNYENESMQSQLLILASGEDFMEDASLQACQSEIIEYNLTLIEPIVTDVSNVSFSYFETFEDMSNNNPIANPENYININNLTHVYIKGYVEGGCSDFSQIELSTIPIPTANSLSPIICDDNSDGVSEIVLNQYISQINSDSDASISFYEDQDLTTLINPEINYTVGEGDIIYVKVLTGNCQNESTITITLGNYTLNSISNFEICSDDINSPHVFYLNEKSYEIATTLGVSPSSIRYYESLQDARTGNSPLNSSYQNQNNPQTIYASYDSFNECPDIVSFDLILQQNPIFEMVDFYKKCFGESIEITAPDGFSYIWNTGETSQHIVVESEGEYFVEISNLHCSVTRQIFVEDFQPITIDYVYENSVLNLNISTNDNLEYSLNGIFWQNSSVFINMKPGEYEVWIRNEAGCIQKETIYLYEEIPNFISPNNDGHNDVWDVSFLRGVLDIRIFDRYGKNIYEVSGENTTPWNGFYTGRELPSGNYWYIIRFINGHQINGNIYLKNYL